jgi:ribosomal protein S18
MNSKGILYYSKQLASLQNYISEKERVKNDDIFT